MSKAPHGFVPPEANNRIREIRLKRRMNLHDLAELSGFTYATLQRWETTGRIPVQKLKRLAEVLGVTPSDLLAGSEAPRIDTLSGEQQFLLQRFESASPEIRKAILRAVKGLTDRDDDGFATRPTKPSTTSSRK